MRRSASFAHRRINAYNDKCKGSMFTGLSQKLSDIFDKLKKRGLLTEEIVVEALREVRIALLEADVALPVVKDFIASVKEKAIGQEVLESVTPGQQVIKVVHDELVSVLGEESADFQLTGSSPIVVMMVGLQGSGKTTMTGKIAKLLAEKQRKKVLLASLDTYRPAAQEQLAVLAKLADVSSVEIIADQNPLEIAKRALTQAKKEGFDVLFLDTAGRTVINQELMDEVKAISAQIKPSEVLLVADAMTGQDAVNVAKAFDEAVSVTGICLTRIDGDARGGAALSMHAVTKKPIRFLGVGEKIGAIEGFYPRRIADRILGMGDIVTLVEKAAEAFDQEESAKLEAKVMKGQFDLNDMATQLRQVTKMGSLSSIMGMLPGMGKLKDKIGDANLDDSLVKRQIAIISSMTKKERRYVKLLNGSRRKRIADGAGVDVQDVNKLIKQFLQMQTMMKKVQKLGKSGLMRQGLQGLMPKPR